MGHLNPLSVSNAVFARLHLQMSDYIMVCEARTRLLEYCATCRPIRKIRSSGKNLRPSEHPRIPTLSGRRKQARVQVDLASCDLEQHVGLHQYFPAAQT